MWPHFSAAAWTKSLIHGPPPSIEEKVDNSDGWGALARQWAHQRSSQLQPHYTNNVALPPPPPPPPPPSPPPPPIAFIPPTQIQSNTSNLVSNASQVDPSHLLIQNSILCTQENPLHSQSSLTLAFYIQVMNVRRDRLNLLVSC
ncbi:unnamed protein product [Schistosoma margrebowiei]|uniref:Uncharacterized protein n=1 Tax=Schistosoma margrebowiei TaxID=48269 RepID=A0A183LUB4_9TREM|nr:unnamed protein product [Schistosoma margrebowiei]